MMETNKNTLLLDQDGVMADTMGGIFRLLDNDYPGLCHADIKDYWFKDMHVPQGAFIEALRTPGLYRGLDVITGAIRAVNKLRERYDVRVVTAPMSGCEESCEAEKREWLAEHFDNDFAEQAIVTSDKTKILGRLILEDNPDISRHASWQPIMFDQPWNQHVADLPVMKNWGNLSVIHQVYKESE
jgi:5'(3')-deoxyribonucleotidase